ncbi:MULTISPECIES: TetR/AcrR family transcriptional regulator [unclassified Pseudofrankia]|uniref:TetR/AcrR family transcriptional regulator n=1 Tax=unclassified Pseudofrankia TaxID=2994372 RepID=UPI0008DAD24A|nr:MULTISPECIES: TetR/AcrR family transcriptional regulator [unclassified Pseudofrankia]MDT3442763.1 TetR/AcrR family transcriptional regulator C-terminal ligand-binding domain-containing protein [Pseudofrankia sp. BMG5.37]OHV44215.1 TetR family transcriptional regulator [Pseudofrankia sp. BMG5.36]
MSEPRPTRRPGGRSARVRATVHRAVTGLIVERGYGHFTVGDVATRATVADSSIYRRWGTLETLLTDVAITWLTTTSPIPDTGGLEQDLRTYAANVARDLTGPDGLAVLRLVIALSSAGEAGIQARDAFLAERGRQLQDMLDRALDRGEHPPEGLDILDHILAPMYVRVLFGAGPLTPAYTDTLVDRLLALRGYSADPLRRSGRAQD